MPVKKIIKAVLPGRAGNTPGGPTTKRVNLALQGGGAHGAFTWGVLERLLSDDRLVIEGVSGTSSGAINAIMLTDGLARGGRPEAQKRLTDFWRSVSSTGDLPPMQRAVVERAVVVHAGRRLTNASLARPDVALFFALRFQSAQHQPTQGSGRAFRRFQSRAVVRRHSAFHFGDQCADRPGADLSAREDHGRCGHGVGLPAGVSFMPSRSTACPIGTAATLATP
jgi:hypothetical protein